MKKRRNRVSEESSKRRATVLASRAELEIEQKWFNLANVDYFVAPLVALLAGVWAFSYIGNTTHWDELLYMNLSQYTTPQSWVLNRYGHIYLQKFFFWLAGDSLTGSKVYWCFLYFSTYVLVYLCARKLAGKRGYLIGLIAVLLFCAQPLFVLESGCTFASVTVMFLITLGTFIYLFFPSCSRKFRPFVIMILGLIFFWAVKSKETGICVGILFLGLGENETGVRSVNRLVKDIGWVCLGMITGCVVLMSLDLVFMGDFWFSVRPSSIEGLMGFNTGEWPHDERGSSVYKLFSLDPILLPFLLYLLVGWMPFGRRLSRHESIAWLVPFGVIFFMIAVTIRMKATAEYRYFMPAIPGICIWAAQFFNLSLIRPEHKSKDKPGREKFESKGLVLLKKSLTGFAPVFMAFIIVLLLTHKMPGLIKGAGWKRIDRFYMYVILPLATTGLLMCPVIISKRGPIALFLSSLCLFFVVYIPLESNLTLLKQRVAARKSEWRFKPYRAFEGELRFDKDVKLLVSQDIYVRSKMLGRNKKSHCWMFNIFYNQKFDYDRFIEGGRENILKGNYTYAFVTWREWRKITEEHNVDGILRDYILKPDKETQTILLKKR